MARLLADNNFPWPVLLELRRLGHDVIGLGETGIADQGDADEDVLRASVTTDRLLLTLDYRSFARLHPRAHHPGLIVCAFDPDFTGQAHRIDTALSTHDSLAGQIIRVGRQRTLSA